MAAANDAELRAVFRKPNFRGGLTPGKTLMNEEQARELELQGTTVEELIAQAASKDATQLDLSFCKLLAFPTSVLALESLTELHLQKNYLATLPEDIGRLNGLRRLNVKENRLSVLPASVVMCEELTSLDASNNQLTSVPDEYGDLPALQHLILDYNAMSEIPKCVRAGMPALKELALIENASLTSLSEDFGAWAPHRQRPARPLELRLDNSPELSASCDKMVAAFAANGSTQAFSVAWNKIWPDLVIDNVYLGSLRTVQNKSVYDQLLVSHVLTCGRNLKIAHMPPGVKHLVLEVDDNDTESINVHFSKGIDFIKDGVKGTAAGPSVLVHCFAGVSRSATMIVAFLMREKHMPFAAAMQHVKEQRPAANPNPNFIQQLKEFEKSCTASK